MGESEKYWRIHGEEDVTFQRQAQVTWWSVLGGVAVAALLTQLEPMIAAVREWKMVFLIIFHSNLSHHDQFVGSNSVGKHCS